MEPAPPAPTLPPTSPAGRLAHLIRLFYTLPPALLALVCISTTLACHLFLPRPLGLPLLLLAAFLPVWEDLLRGVSAPPRSAAPGLDPAADPARPARDPCPLDLRQWFLLALGLALAGAALPWPNLAVLLANCLFVYWVGLRPWDWLRRDGCFFMVESFYLATRVWLPRPGYQDNPLFTHLLPHVDFCAFLWFGIEAVFFLKALDFVLWTKVPAERARYSFPRFLLFAFHPCAFFAGPVIGSEDMYRSYRLGGPTPLQAFGAAGKCLLGVVRLFLLTPWLTRQVTWLRHAVLEGDPITDHVPSQLLMWCWLAGMSVLLQFIYVGYVDVMLGLARLAGFDFPEQFRFNLFARDPVEYWQNGNRAVYKITHYHIFNRFFDPRNLTGKAMFATAASGGFHVFLCPTLSLNNGLLLGGLFALNGLVVAGNLRLRRSERARRLAGWVEDGPPRNALLLAGVVATFTLLTFTRATFLLAVQGVSVAEWRDLMTSLFLSQSENRFSN